MTSNFQDYINFKTTVLNKKETNSIMESLGKIELYKRKLELLDDNKPIDRIQIDSYTLELHDERIELAKKMENLGKIPLNNG